MLSPRRLFTLLELLVAIAVLLVLTAVLLPALGQAKAMGKRLSCASNLRQVVQGCFLYVDDNGDWLPPTRLSSTHIAFVNEYLRQRYDGYVRNAVVDGYLYFAKPRGLYFCPSCSDPPQSSPTWRGSAAASFYLSNYMQTQSSSGSDIDDFAGWSVSVYNYYRRLGRIPGNCVLLGEMDWSSNAGSSPSVYLCKVLLGGYSSYLGANNGVAYGWNHNLSANFAFKDGHAQNLKYQGVDLFAGAFAGVGGFVVK